MEISLKRVEIPNGEKLAYRERRGGEELLILVHGNMSSSKHWDLLMEAIDGKFKIYAIDLRGFGESSYNQSINSLKDFSQDLKLFVELLQLDYFHLMGWSTGGGVAMQFAADYPDYIHKLILMESVGTKGYPIFKKDENGQAIMGEFLTTRAEIAEDPVQVLPILQAYQNKDKQTLRMLWNSLIYHDNQPTAERYDHYLEEMLKQRNLVDVDYALATFNISMEHNGVKAGNSAVTKIKAPTLILQGKNDQVVPAQMALDIKKDIGEKARLVYLENCGHSPLTDDLEQLLKNITDFLEK